MDRSTATFERERGRLTGIAYGLLGSYSEAEDAVQEAWLRYNETGAKPERPEAWLTTVVSRIALDRLRSAQHRRETYPGEWLPEPVSALPDPETSQGIRSLLSIGFLHLLEKLGPEERAVVVLRGAFERSYEEIAGIVGKPEAACRQMHVRAQRRLKEGGSRRLAPAPEHLVRACIDALAHGDERRLLGLLAPDAVLYGDGGGRVPSVLKPVYGAERIARFFAGVQKKLGEDYRAEYTEVNGAPALRVRTQGRVSVLALSFEHDRITAIHIIGNPEKLRAVLPPSLEQ